MNTPIYDFIRSYSGSNAARFHMPGHKGRPLPGAEACDITEFEGADDLYAPSGIIAQSQANASALFGCPTFYSTEGSSLCIRAMLYLCSLWSAANGKKRTRILAGRNAHKTFINAAALLDIDVDWLIPEKDEGYLSCSVSLGQLERELSSGDAPCAVYLTSPDYLGGMADIPAAAELCRRYGTLLLTDCAHGAYLKFLPSSLFPTDLGADICCSSAHKTLPVLTGGAYLHISRRLPSFFTEKAADALALFGSTSPSYLILQSLDLVNPYLEKLPRLLSDFLPTAQGLKKRLEDRGLPLYGREPMKLTVRSSAWGYTGDELSSLLSAQGVMCEYHDRDFAVFMLSCQNSPEELERLEKALCAVPRLSPLASELPAFTLPKKVMSGREALFADSEVLPAEQCLGRVLASACVSCPPAVPILVSGELIDENGIKRLIYYGVESCTVVRR